jgi:electron transport complex protein RnfB
LASGNGRRTRREFLAEGFRAAGLLAAGGALGALGFRKDKGPTVWQIDPDKCVQCGKCATACVLNPSAVKCVHQYVLCGYCDLCFGFFEDQRPGNQEGAENERCPTNAIRRSFVEEPYYEYVIDESLCIGCGRCVKGCLTFGNGSLILQVRHDRCLNCNQCEIARVCPANAFVRVPAHQPYLLRVGKRSD